MIPDAVVDEVRARADIVEVVSESVPLKKSGKDWKGKCPFHDDHSPSFYVVPDKGFYKCFGCGESGDVFTFLMKRSGMEFLDAVRYLGGRYGIEIREVTGGREEDDPFRALYEANAFAREWFRERLLDPDAGKPARSYLERRGIGLEVAERFGLGFAPDAWRGLREAAAKHGIGDDLLLEVGLLTTSERSAEPYDRFRNRVIFPIESVTGRVVGFGGRIVSGEGEGVPKYLNSPESPIYHKGDTLYGLGWNRNAIRREGVALLVEGYMDVVALAAVGIEHAVAALGTAVTEEHARLLTRYTRRALLLFDSDEAGERATFRTADALLAHGIHPSVVTLPPGEDPDTLVRAQGAAGLKRFLDAAVDVMDRKLQLLDEKGYFGSIEKVRAAVDKLLPTLRAVRDPALRDIYLASVARRTGVRTETLEEEVARGSRPTTPSGVPAPMGPTSRGLRPGPRGRASGGELRRAGFGAERKILLVLLRDRTLVERTLERIGPEEFRDPSYRAIFEALSQNPELEALPPGMSPEAERRFDELMGSPEDVEHTEQIFLDSLRVLEDQGPQARQAAMKTEIAEAGSEDEERRLLEESARLRRERSGGWNVIRRGGPVGIGGDDQRVNE
jgi:DNA primase